MECAKQGCLKYGERITLCGLITVSLCDQHLAEYHRWLVAEPTWRRLREARAVRDLLMACSMGGMGYSQRDRSQVLDGVQDATDTLNRVLLAWLDEPSEQQAEGRLTHGQD